MIAQTDVAGMTPREIVVELDKYIVGQAAAKRLFKSSRPRAAPQNQKWSS